MLFGGKTSLSTIISFCYCVIDNSILSSSQVNVRSNSYTQEEMFIERKLISKRIVHKMFNNFGIFLIDFHACPCLPFDMLIFILWKSFYNKVTNWYGWLELSNTSFLFLNKEYIKRILLILLTFKITRTTGDIHIRLNKGSI